MYLFVSDCSKLVLPSYQEKQLQQDKCVLKTPKLLYSFVLQQMGKALVSADGYCTTRMKDCEAAVMLWLFVVWPH